MSETTKTAKPEVIAAKNPRKTVDIMGRTPSVASAIEALLGLHAKGKEFRTITSMRDHHEDSGLATLGMPGFPSTIEITEALVVNTKMTDLKNPEMRKVQWSIINNAASSPDDVLEVEPDCGPTPGYARDRGLPVVRRPAVGHRKGGDHDGVRVDHPDSDLGV